MVTHVPVTIQVLDVNDNIPAIAGGNSAVIVCEGTKYGQVGFLMLKLREQRNSLLVFGWM
ncbi:hypothetical protein F7725_011989 [Dissostichus mawsoni]|uniref:Cadherin domain-containing protein n=1 Tax=Dissostichus mawsoni TaxID=36200 RepID=A0A7J5ZEJ7_DISMA|nr:hypothetical protein F7725_011989 [Dissostichus mawsoni]